MMPGVGRGYHRNEAHAFSVPLHLPCSKSRGRMPPMADMCNEAHHSPGPKSPCDPDEAILEEYFSPRKSGNDTLILVEKREICVASGTLFWFSDQFRNLISPITTAYNNIKFYWPVDTSKFTFNEIFEMLKCIFHCPTPKRVDKSNIAVLLKISFQLEIKQLQGNCKQFFNDFIAFPYDSNFDNLLFEYLRLASHYKLMDVLPNYVARIAVLDPALIRSKYDALSPTLIALILDAKVSALSEEMKRLLVQQAQSRSMDDFAFGIKGSPGAHPQGMDHRADASTICNDGHFRPIADDTPIQMVVNEFLLNTLYQPGLNPWD